MEKASDEISFGDAWVEHESVAADLQLLILFH